MTWEQLQRLLLRALWQAAWWSGRLRARWKALWCYHQWVRGCSLTFGLCVVSKRCPHCGTLRVLSVERVHP